MRGARRGRFHFEARASLTPRGPGLALRRRLRPLRVRPDGQHGEGEEGAERARPAQRAQRSDVEGEDPEEAREDEAAGSDGEGPEGQREEPVVQAHSLWRWGLRSPGKGTTRAESSAMAPGASAGRGYLLSCTAKAPRPPDGLTAGKLLPYFLHLPVVRTTRLGTPRRVCAAALAPGRRSRRAARSPRSGRRR